MPMDPGLGDDLNVLLHYNKTQDKCLPFHYRGKGGNENRFFTDRWCMQNCSSSAVRLYPADEKEACHLPRDFGHCMSRYLLWYYDSFHGKCKTFRFTGCGGNGNRFLSEHHCNTTCAGIIDEGNMEEEEAESDTPSGLIIGIVLGVIGAVIMIVTVVMVVKNKKPKTKETKKMPKGDDSPLQPEGMEMA
ncbi:kunitz-type U19-barytoxin-Tl1a isoform X2 [Anguilla anguilla]|nr:kunitz-type U19-barytoxin-Tl1a isoform X2 [Anguilla anguilla]XP_035251473.1 kunitz-type U19-barytoxin-Tl1a isoform X2 [Anguilla anguilla]XP_035251474.1 kunitz-type U19-barytoxin-Tl1a isoform X2 [Anguilla anguilla]